jgi:predicted Zn-dependent protease
MIVRPLRSLVVASILAAVFLQLLGPRLVEAYVLFGNKWCDNDATLSLQTSGGSAYVLAHQPVYDAASAWSAVSSNFNYTQLGENQMADVWVFSTPWGGPGSSYAVESHFAPGTCRQSSNVTFNTMYSWNPPYTTCNGSTSWVSLYSVALHELGHSVGLNHSGDVNAIMYATMDLCTNKPWNQDDIDGIRAIYD